MQQAAGIPDSLIGEFVAHLERRGRGSYTVRSYRLGLVDFSRWLKRAGRELDEVGRRDVEAYIGAFAAGPGQGPASPEFSILRPVSPSRFDARRGLSTTG